MDTHQFNPAKNPLFDIKEEGSVVNTAPIRKIDFTGTGVTATETAAGEMEVAIPSSGLLQAVVQQYNPSAAQALTTTYADVAGSDYSFTPLSASSKIVYQYLNVHHKTGNGTGIGIFHWQTLVDGVAETESSFTQRAFENNFDITTTIASWGTTAKTIKLQAREYDASFPGVLFETFQMDGATSSVLVRPTLMIQEFA